IDGSGNYNISPSSEISLQADTNIAGTLAVASSSDFTGLATFEGNLRISDGSSNFATITVNSLSNNYTVTIPTITANDTFCLQFNNCSYISASLTDNIANALDIQQGTNNYINIRTTNGSEEIQLGNTTT